MKLHLSLVCVVCMASARADLPPLSFPAPTLELPSLSLADVARSGKNAMTISSTADAWVRSIGAQRVPLPPRAKSQMPILEPKADIDPKMVIKPDENIDPKMLIEIPQTPQTKLPHKKPAGK